MYFIKELAHKPDYMLYSLNTCELEIYQSYKEYERSSKGYSILAVVMSVF